MGRSPCCSKEGLNRGAWTALEDKILTEYIKVNGEGKWRNLPKRAGLKRCGKSCRLRWLNYLRPDIKRGNITRDEEELIIRLHNLLGNRWALIAGRLPGRTDNEIKNYWNTNIGKRIQSSSGYNHQDHIHDNAIPKTTCRIRPPKPSSNNTKPSHHDHAQQQQDQPPSPRSLLVASPKCSRVVRTRATRCTKVVFFPPVPHDIKPQPPDLEYDHVDYSKPTFMNDDHDDHDHALFIPHAASNIDGHDHDHGQQISAVHEPLLVPSLDDRDRSSPNFLAEPLYDNDNDNDNFLAELLNVDCLQHFSNSAFGDINNVVNDDVIIEPSCSSLSSSGQNHHHREAFLFEQEMLSSLIDPELDWLINQD